MREIKYKAYWHESKLMTTVDTIEFFKGGTRVSDGCVHTGWLGKDCELLQYTGLKDKNGIEIYKGYIVKCGGRVGVVIFGRGMFEGEGFGIDEKECLWNLVVDECEVVGNSFENPELLEEANG